jgi:tetratricopeptide (TPR) repeat protein
MVSALNLVLNAPFTNRRLEEAVAEYRAALEEGTRERAPLQWASTQNNLGAALQALGTRESGTARLEEAVGVYRAALEKFAAAKLEEFTAEAASHWHEIVQGNLACLALLEQRGNQ